LHSHPSRLRLFFEDYLSPAVTSATAPYLHRPQVGSHQKNLATRSTQTGGHALKIPHPRPTAPCYNEMEAEEIASTSLTGNWSRASTIPPSCQAAAAAAAWASRRCGASSSSAYLPAGADYAKRQFGDGRGAHRAVPADFNHPGSAVVCSRTTRRLHFSSATAPSSPPAARSASRRPRVFGRFLLVYEFDATAVLDKIVKYFPQTRQSCRL